MTREQMLDRMKDRNLNNQELLGLMIEKWEDIRDFLQNLPFPYLNTDQRGELLNLDQGIYNCALCEAYFYGESNLFRCDSCIIFNIKHLKRKRRCCYLTPLWLWTRYLTFTNSWRVKKLLYYANLELDFLNRLKT
tara:strand:- start:46 stop:450 length:405 start_codon:yes stop_codon:yes gene_type:complete